MKEYSEEMKQSRFERRNAKTNPVRKSSWDDHRRVASLVMHILEVSFSIHDRYAPFGDDATITSTEDVIKNVLGSQFPSPLSTKATMGVFDDHDQISSTPLSET
jgi:hypothetical protein